MTTSIRRVCKLCGHSKYDFNPFTNQCEAFDEKTLGVCKCKTWEPIITQVKEVHETRIMIRDTGIPCPHCSDCRLAQNADFGYLACRVGCCIGPMNNQANIPDNYACTCLQHYATRRDAMLD